LYVSDGDWTTWAQDIEASPSPIEYHLKEVRLFLLCQPNLVLGSRLKPNYPQSTRLSQPVSTWQAKNVTFSREVTRQWSESRVDNIKTRRFLKKVNLFPYFFLQNCSNINVQFVMDEQNRAIQI